MASHSPLQVACSHSNDYPHIYLLTSINNPHSKDGPVTRPLRPTMKLSRAPSGPVDLVSLHCGSALLECDLQGSSRVLLAPQVAPTGLVGTNLIDGHTLHTVRIYLEALPVWGPCLVGYDTV